MNNNCGSLYITTRLLMHGRGSTSGITKLRTHSSSITNCEHTVEHTSVEHTSVEQTTVEHTSLHFCFVICAFEDDRSPNQSETASRVGSSSLCCPNVNQSGRLNDPLFVARACVAW